MHLSQFTRFLSENKCPLFTRLGGGVAQSGHYLLFLMFFLYDGLSSQSCGFHAAAGQRNPGLGCVWIGSWFVWLGWVLFWVWIWVWVWSSKIGAHLGRSLLKDCHFSHSPSLRGKDSVRGITAEVGIGFTPFPFEKNSHFFSFSLKGCGRDFFSVTRRSRRDESHWVS